VALIPKLRRFAFSLTGNQPDGDDLVQSACEKALRNQDQFQIGSRMDSRDVPHRPDPVDG